MNTQPNSLIRQAISQSAATLQKFAGQADFLEQLEVAFGDSFDRHIALGIVSQLRSGDLRSIDIESAIFQLLLTSSPPMNQGDSNLTEQRKLVSRQQVSPQMLSKLRAKQDRQDLNIGGQSLEIDKPDLVETESNNKLSATPSSGSAGLFSLSSNGQNSDHEAAKLIGLERFYDNTLFTGINGGGFAVVVIDSGIDRDHPFFGADADGNGISDRIVFSTDFSDGKDGTDVDASDTDGHGTHVSGIVASTARGVDIIHLKVFPDGADTQASGAAVEQALQWVIDNRQQFNIVAVNMSLGSNNLNTETVHSVIGNELQTLVNNGVIPVAAAGNAYDGVAGVSSYSADPNALSVGSVFDANVGSITWRIPTDDPNVFITRIDNTTAADRIVSTSQRGALLDIFAPGSLITAANNGGGFRDLSGTSMAAPHISGIVALAQQLAVRTFGRRLTFQEFRNLLQTTGVTINDGDDENDNVTNTGLNYKRVDVFALGEGILTGQTGILPTANTDILRGNDLANYMAGFGGGDYLYGGGGGDTLVGGVGNDALVGEFGNDTLFGDADNDSLYGEAGKDYLHGGIGQDQLYGGNDDDQLDGSYGNDTLDGGAGNDTLYGEEDIDTLYGNQGTDTLDGGAGNDKLFGGNETDYLYGSLGSDSLYGGAGNDTLNGNKGEEHLLLGGLFGYDATDYLYGEIGNDTLYGDGGDDNLFGGADSDFLYGDTGHDYLDGGVGNDLLKGGAGNDTYIIDINDVVIENINEGIDSVQSSVSLTLSANVENLTIMGGNGYFYGTGNNLNNYISGSGGTHSFSGAAGNDTLNGDQGNDTFDGGVGNDLMIGFLGNDTYVIDADIDTGIDTITDIASEDWFPGIVGGIDALDFRTTTTTAVNVNLSITNQRVATGVELVISKLEIENVYGGTLNDNLTGNRHKNALFGGNGNDYLDGGAGDDTLTGGAGDDTYIIDNINDIVIENINEGIDTVQSSISLGLIANVENFVFTGVNGNLFAIGNNLNNLMIGIGGTNNFSGGIGNDTLSGGTGNDRLFGEADNDRLWGGSGIGNDYLEGGAGDDTYLIDADVDLGVDTIIETVTSGIDDVIDFRDTTTTGITIDLSKTTNQIIATGVELIIPVVSIEGVYASDGNDTIIGNSMNNYLASYAGNDTLNGGAGNDLIWGGSGNDNLDGGDGNDYLHGSVGSNSMAGGNGNDVYDIDAGLDLGLQTIIESATGGTDLLNFNHTLTKAVSIDLSKTTTQTVATGVQLVIPVVSIENVYGGGGSDTISGNNLNNYLTGDVGNDNLRGGAGDDELAGDVGNDTLNGGIGNDIVYGGAGNDRFLFNGGVPLTGANTVASLLGRDIIADFIKNQDKISLSKNTFAAINTAVGVSLGANFATVDNDTLAGGSAGAIVYSQQTGNLFYNQNGTDAGYGNGGNFAVVSGIPVLTDSNFAVVA